MVLDNRILRIFTVTCTQVFNDRTAILWYTYKKVLQSTWWIMCMVNRICLDNNIFNINTFRKSQ